MEELIVAIRHEDYEDDGLLVYCVSGRVMGIFKKRKEEGYCFSVIGRYLMDSVMKFGGFFRVSRHFPFHL
jgi:hypothetical protein